LTAVTPSFQTTARAVLSSPTSTYHVLEAVSRESEEAPSAAFVRADRWAAVRMGFVLAYVAAYAYWFRRNGLILDRISVALSVTALLLICHIGLPWYRWRQLTLDLAVYAAMWLAYEQTRSAADGLGMPLQVESVRNIDRALFFGADPNVWLQRRFYSPDVVRWYDVAASVVYYTHFVVPVAAIVALWVLARHEWVRYMRRLATVLLVACVSFVLLPTAPPWIAGGGEPTIRLDALPPVARPQARGWRHLGLDWFAHAWEVGKDWLNFVAAMPSLHGAFSLLVVVYFFPWIRRWSIRLTLLLYPVAMCLVLVYLGEHYVIDVVAGWIIVGVSFAVWGRLERRARSRRAAVSRAAVERGVRHDDVPNDPVLAPS